MKKYWELLKQFIKFNIVGIMNTLVDLGIFALLTGPAHWGDTLAKTISYSCGVLNSYLWNSNWTFKSERKRTPREVLLFLLVNLVSYGASIAILYACREWLHIENSTLRNLIATPISVVINFVGNKLFVFRKGENPAE